ncbi:hypothetical protein CWI38_0328p0010 [Hamiltosporidium tvaerminnensis]|uniref:Uncharacterized protein n=1 Tax=Hamiltosporidium tvaerminnensis TaxID=1176355 RepID=A0A4Q9M141_9MICR|nr:hypothetical protein CWI38_0328p0010 [Hamiltosporidium tvaerminnensis]
MDKDDVMQTLTAETVNTIDDDDSEEIMIEETEEYVSQGQNEMGNAYISLSKAHSEVEIALILEVILAHSLKESAAIEIYRRNKLRINYSKLIPRVKLI